MGLLSNRGQVWKQVQKMAFLAKRKVYSVQELHLARENTCKCRELTVPCMAFGYPWNFFMLENITFSLQPEMNSKDG